MTTAMLDFYRTPGSVTDLGRYKDFVRWLTDDVRAIYQVVQGLLIHGGWMGRYRSDYIGDGACDADSVYMQDLLDKVTEMQPDSLAIPRSPGKRIVCCCREFATLLCAILRGKGIASRSRCGFATYLAAPGYFEDHWICEYWSEGARRWVRIDPQIDPFQQSVLKMQCNPLDLSDSDFVTAGQAWKRSRTQEIAADRFGISADPKPLGLKSLYGLWFTRGQLLRDFAALNKVETVPYLVRVEKGLSWDSWRLLAKRDDEVSQAEYGLLDEIAELSLDPDTNFDRIRDCYRDRHELQPPAEILLRRT